MTKPVFTQITCCFLLIASAAPSGKAAEFYQVRGGIPNSQYFFKANTVGNQYLFFIGNSVLAGTGLKEMNLRCAFFDMTGPWWTYIQESGKTYGWFMGDAVHANARGCQIIGRLLEIWFKP